MKFTVAIDGPAAAGKGTISKGIAAHFGFAHLDTGLLYRAVARKVLLGANPAQAAQTLTAKDLSRDDLRTPVVAQAASEVAVNPQVRSALLSFQREFARRNGGAVLDGRDIGTVICPDADVKIFITANDLVRARRRHGELIGKGVKITLEQVRQDLYIRDTRDAERVLSPTKQALNSVTIDTSDLAVDAALDAAIKLGNQAYLTAN